MTRNTFSSFAAAGVQHDREFLSFREAIETLSSHTNELQSEVARVLMIKRFQDMNCAYLGGSHKTIYRESSGRFIHALLSKTVRSGKIDETEMPEEAGYSKETASPDEHGWYRFHFASMLWRDELPCPTSLSAGLEDMPKNASAGRRTLAASSCDAVVEVDRLKSEVRRLTEELEAALLPHNGGSDSPTNSAPFAEQVVTLTHELEAQKSENNRLSSLVPPISDYLIPLVVAVQKEFWVNWDASKPRPKATVIIAWIQEEFPAVATSGAIASAVEKVACPIARDLSSGR